MKGFREYWLYFCCTHIIKTNSILNFPVTNIFYMTTENLTKWELWNSVCLLAHWDIHGSISNSTSYNIIPTITINCLPFRRPMEEIQAGLKKQSRTQIIFIVKRVLISKTNAYKLHVFLFYSLFLPVFILFNSRFFSRFFLFNSPKVVVF